MKGCRSGNKSFKVHLDGYNLLPFFKGEIKESPRREFLYWSDDGDLMAIRVVPNVRVDEHTIQQADYFAHKRQLRVGAKSTTSGATLRVYVTSTGALIGTLQNLGDGRYPGSSPGR